uniref:Bulb-type lectin domain-containing protein n=1 Tax=Brassica oleracea var. oleracea TaxID=109376 RepID=A0A0D3ASA4_BRAOL
MDLLAPIRTIQNPKYPNITEPIPEMPRPSSTKESCGGSVSSTLSITEPLELSKNSTLVSPNKLFELGFFQSQTKWYLGKRWKQDTDKTILWVANRNVPLLESYGVLKFMENNLVILNESRDLIWSRNLSGSVTRYVWQSFDHPTDTLLPGMKLDPVEPSKHLYSWVTSDDTSAGDLWLEITNYPDGIIAIYVMNYIMDTWNGFLFNENIPQQQLELNNGAMRGLRYTHVGPRDNVWNLSWSIGADACYWGGIHETCGSYSVCSKNALCHCIQGVSEMLEGGCITRTPMKCEEDIFEELQKMKLPTNGEHTNGSIYFVEDCEKVSFENCDCKSFGLVESRKSQCIGGQDLYIRAAASDNEKKLVPMEGYTWHFQCSPVSEN